MIEIYLKTNTNYDKNGDITLEPTSCTVSYTHLDVYKRQAPYVEYEVLNETGSMYAENEEIATNYKIQIDVFTKGSYTVIVNLIKKIMKENGLMKEFGGSLYEDVYKRQVLSLLMQIRN